LGSVFFAGLEVEAVEFEEENANYKPCPFVAIDERMVAGDAGCVQRSHHDDVHSFGVGVVLAGTRKSRL